MTQESCYWILQKTGTRSTLRKSEGCRCSFTGPAGEKRRYPCISHRPVHAAFGEKWVLRVTLPFPPCGNGNNGKSNAKNDERDTDAGLRWFRCNAGTYHTAASVAVTGGTVIGSSRAGGRCTDRLGERVQWLVWRGCGSFGRLGNCRRRSVDYLEGQGLDEGALPRVHATIKDIQFHGPGPLPLVILVGVGPREEEAYAGKWSADGVDLGGPDGTEKARFGKDHLGTADIIG